MQRLSDAGRPPESMANSGDHELKTIQAWLHSLLLRTHAVENRASTSKPAPMQGPWQLRAKLIVPATA
jgi:hypothetical protein